MLLYSVAASTGRVQGSPFVRRHSLIFLSVFNSPDSGIQQIEKKGTRPCIRQLDSLRVRLEFDGAVHLRRKCKLYMLNLARDQVDRLFLALRCRDFDRTRVQRRKVKGDNFVPLLWSVTRNLWFRLP